MPATSASFPVPRLPSLSTAADLFDPAALFWLGYCYHHGDAEAGIAPDGRQALRHLELAAGMGHPGAAHYLSRLYRNGETPHGVQGQQRKAAGGCGSGGCGSGSCSTSATAASSTDGSCASTSAADCEAAGCSPEKISDCESSGKLSAAGASGSCSTGGGSCGTSGGSCGSGGCGPKVRTGVEGPVGSGPLHLEPDPARAAYFLGLAADAGHAEAMFEVADAHYHGRLAELPPSLRASASSGSSAESGRNVAAALRMYEEAAAAGHAEAAICAGAIYFKGEPGAGIARDPQRALSLYTQAAHAGSAAGWENVAAILATGARGEDGSLVIPPNRETAAFIRARMLASASGSMQQVQGQGQSQGRSKAAAGGAGAAAAGQSPAAAASASAPEPSAGEIAGDGDGIIRTSVYRASDPDVAVAGTRRGSGDSPEDPIELDMSTGTAARVLESLTRRPQ